jgi:hypothetical protein
MTPSPLVLLLSLSVIGYLAAFFVRKWVNPLLMIGSAFLALSIAELISGTSLVDPANAMYFKSDHYEKYDGREFPFGKVPVAGSFSIDKRTKDEIIYQAVYTFGNDGFRVTPMQEGLHSAPRINFFGGSYMFGEGLNDDETFAYYTTQVLQNVGSKNYGMHGWGVHNALAILEHLDVGGEVNVLLTAPWHASRSSCVNAWTGYHPKYQLDQAGKVERSGVCRDDHERRLFYGFLSQSSLYSVLRSRFSPTEKVTREMLNLYFGLIAEIKARSEKNGQVLVVGYINISDWFFSDGASNSDAVSRYSEIADFAVDLTLTDEENKLPRRYRLHELDWHPSAEANLERAKRLKPVLEKIIGQRVDDANGS